MDLQKEDAKISLENVLELNDEALEKVTGGRDEHRGDDWHHRHDNDHRWDWHRHGGHDWNWRHRR